MTVLKIVKENFLNIPIGTFLHAISFNEGSKKMFNDNDVWITHHAFVYKLDDNKINIIKYKDFQSFLKNCYHNCIMLYNKRKYITEGSEYWKVIYNKDKLKFHKLEFKDGKHYPAELFKPYKDIVHDNTNTCHSDYYYFETKSDAEEFCEKMKNYFANK